MLSLPTHILSVQEDPYYAELLQYAFIQNGAEWSPTVQYIENAEGALNLLHEQRYQGRLQPDLILLDLVNHESSLKALRCLKQDSHAQDIPVMILSSSHSGVDLAKCVFAGADGYITRPTGYKRIISHIQEAWRDRPLDSNRTGLLV
jgi:CheY-like chemotaxis protein